MKLRRGVTSVLAVSALLVGCANGSTAGDGPGGGGDSGTTPPSTTHTDGAAATDAPTGIPPGRDASSPPGTDTGTPPMFDSGTPGIDASSPTPDSSSPTPDTGTPPIPDSGSGTPDTGTVMMMDASTGTTPACPTSGTAGDIYAGEAAIAFTNGDFCGSSSSSSCAAGDCSYTYEGICVCVSQ